MPTADQSPRLIPFDHLDKLCYVIQSKERGISFSPVWQLGIRGNFDERAARMALEALARRYPTLASRAVSIDGDKPIARARKLAYRLDSEMSADSAFCSVDLTGASDDEYREFQQRIFNNHLELESDYPILLTWARTGPKRGTLFVQQHHSIADGKAFFELLDDFCAFYDRAARGEKLDAIAVIPKLAEATVAEPRRWRRILHRHLGYWLYLRMMVLRLFQPIGQLALNLGKDYSGNNSVVHAYVDGATVERIRGLKATTGYSVNDFLSTALALTLYRWSDAQGVSPKRFTLLIPADARPRDWEGKSFANHLCSYVVLIRGRMVARPVDLLRSVHRQIRKQFRRRHHIKALLAGIQLIRLLSIGTLQRLIFGAEKTVLNFSFSNLVPISPTENSGRFVTSDWEGERLEIMTPCGWLQGINTTVIQYAGQLCFNFNYKASVVDPAEVREMISLFRSALEELVSAVSPK